MIIVPDTFATYTERREGEAGRLWIRSLPGLFEVLCHQWNLVMDGPPMHGGLSLVVPVRRGEACYVLKVGWRDESTAQEALALSAWKGNGAVQLVAAQPECGALLLECLNSQYSLVDVGIEEAVTVAGRLLRRLSYTAPRGHPSSQRYCPTTGRNVAAAMGALWSPDGAAVAGAGMRPCGTTRFVRGQPAGQL